MQRDISLGWWFSKEGSMPVMVDLPHDAMLSEERDPNCHNGENSGFFPGGEYIYEKLVTLSEDAAQKRTELFFEGVYQNCTVLVNGSVAGSHRYGYSEFSVDITGFVKPGENRITVLVDNSLEPNCRWYSGSGIYRPVWLRTWNNHHPMTLTIETESYDPPIIKVRADEGAIIRIYDGDMKIASGNPGLYEIPDAKLWSAETPHLYTCISQINGDEIITTFGIRKLEWSAKTGLLINGQRTLLRGGCIHHDNGILGACGFAEAEERRIRILKEAGYNAIRSAHNPMSRAMLDACDRLGMYVMDEAFDGWYTPKTYHDYSRWFYEDWQGDLAAMVEKDINHPCVIMYSVGNEVTESASSKGVDICGELTRYIHRLDHSRPVTCGINVLLNMCIRVGLGLYNIKGEYKPEPLPPKGTNYRENKAGSAFFNAMAQKLSWAQFVFSAGRGGDRACRGAADQLDILGLNYAASRYDKDAKRYPDRMMVGSETLVTDLPYNWTRVKRYPAVMGNFVWAAWDYLGEAGIGGWIYHSYPGLPILAGSGTIDITGIIGAEAYYQQVVWGLRKQPYICVRPLNRAKETPSRSAWRFTDAVDSWSWAGYEGTSAVVEVFSDAAAIRLELNGKTIGVKKLKAYKCKFKTRYHPGTLTAVALDGNGEELSRQTLSTARAETVLSAVPEKRMLCADGQDLCFIPIEFTDSNGTLKPYIEQIIEITVEGAAVLQGFGSAAIKTDESYLTNRHRSFRGRCLAVLRAGTAEGTATVTIRSRNMKPVEIIIAVQRRSTVR